MSTTPVSEPPPAPSAASLVPRATLRRRLADETAPTGAIHLELSREGDDADALAEIVKRAARAVPVRALVADGGSTITVVLPGATRDETLDAAARLLVAVREAVRVGGEAGADVRAGYAFGESGQVSIELLHQAQRACRAARQQDRATPAEFVEELDRATVRTQRIGAELHSALVDGDLRAHFQPVVSLRDGRVTGLEALVRWPRHQGPMRLPEEFLPVAEAAGLMPDVGQWMLDQVLGALDRLRRLQLDRPLRLWINLGAPEVAGADEVLGRIEAAIADGALNPREIGFEVTESSMLEDVDRAVASFIGLRRLGVEIALDDFGTGYSSLSYLRILPITAVKIDRSFVRDLGRFDADETIVRAVIELAHALGLRVIAEGVEDVAQAEQLVHLGADEAQGFLFGTPSPIDQLDDCIRRRWAGAEAFGPGAALAEAVEGELAERRPGPLPGDSPHSRLLLAALDTAHDAVVVTTAGPTVAAHEIVYVNSRFEADTGLDNSDVVGRSLDALIPPSRRAPLTAWFERAFATGRAASRELRMTRANGTTYPCEMTISPIYNDHGMLTHWLHTSRDITERRLLEAEQRRLNHQRELSAQVGELARRATIEGVNDVLATLDDIIAPFAERLGCELMFVHLLEGDQLRTAAWWSRTDGTSPDDTADLDRSMGRAQRWSTTVDAVLALLRLVEEQRSIADPKPGPWTTELASLLGGRTLGSPLFAGVSINGVLLGVLGATREKGVRAWTDDEIAAVEELANVIANLLQRQRTETALHSDMRTAATRAAYERVEMEVAEWALNLETGPIAAGLDGHLQNIGELLGADSVTLATIDGDGLRRSSRWPRTSAAPLGAPPRLMYADLLDKLPDLEPLIIHDIARSDESYTRQWRDDPAAPQAVMIVPLGSGGHLDGVLAVTSDRPRRWEDGEITFARAIAAIVSSVIGRRRMEASLRLSQSRLEAMLDGSPDFVIVIDDDGVIHYANLAVRTKLGMTIEDLVGSRGLALVHPDDRALASARLATLVRGEPNENTRVRAIAADGSEAGWWEIMSGAQRDPLIGGTILTCRDVTVHVAAERAEATRLNRLRHTFDLAQRALDIGPDAFLGQLDQACTAIAANLGADMARVVQYDEEREEMTVIGRSGAPTDVEAPSLPFAAMPHWLALLREAEPVHVPSVVTCPEPWAAEWSEQTGCHGELMVVAMSVAGRLVGELAVAMRAGTREWSVGELGYLRLVAETIAHVLERARLDAALRASETRFRILSETAADVVILIDETGTIAYASPSSSTLLGYSPAELIGRDATLLLPPGHGELVRLLDDRTSRDGPVAAELELRRADGELIWVAHSTSIVPDPRPSGRVTYRVSVRDITERKRLETELSWQALHDPLTGLGNRIHLQQRLADATADAGLGRGLAVLVIDLDRFKDVNDTHGHAHGDEVLRIVAARLAAEVRPTDTLARTGGDEFVLLCPNTDPHDAVTVAERVVRVLSEPIAINGTVVGVGASIGVAHTPSATSNSDHLLIEADRAMYAAKQTGGGVVVA